MTYAELTTALRVLGLPQQATLAEIHQRHRSLVKAHHPDIAADDDPQTIRRINAAYTLLRDYCATYSYSFSHEEFLRQNPEERMRLQFYDDPVWGNSKPEPD
jgi:DnaJ-class molecular chaperone